MRRMSFSGEYVKLSRFFSCFLTELATSCFFLYLPPLSLLVVIAGLEEAKKPQRSRCVLRLIQIRLT
jgi:hypothetical protein